MKKAIVHIKYLFVLINFCGCTINFDSNSDKHREIGNEYIGQSSLSRFINFAIKYKTKYNEEFLKNFKYSESNYYEYEDLKIYKLQFYNSKSDTSIFFRFEGKCVSLSDVYSIGGKRWKADRKYIPNSGNFLVGYMISIKNVRVHARVRDENCIDNIFIRKLWLR